MNRTFILLATFCFLSQPALAQTDWPAGTLKREQLPKQRALDYEFNEVQISSILSWLRRFNVEPPLELGGQVSGWLWAQAPARGWWKLGDYRVEGELRSPLLDVDRFSIRTARVRFGYNQSLWSVGRAEGQIESRGANAVDRRVLGEADISAQLPTSTTAVAKAQGNLSAIPLIDLLATFGLEENVPTGIARGNFQLSTTLRNIAQPLTWTASGSIQAQQIVFQSLPATNVSTDWSLADAELSLNNTQIQVAGQTIQLAARATLRDKYAFRLQLPSQEIALTSALYNELSAPSEEALPTGRVRLTATTTGTLTPWSAAYSVQLTSPTFSWYENILTNVRMSASMTTEGIELSELTANVGNGSIAGKAQFPTAVAGPVSLNLNFNNIDLASVRGPEGTPKMSGIVTGQGRVTVGRDKLDDFDAMEFSLDGTGTQLRIDEWGLGDVRYSLNKVTNSAELNLKIDDLGQTARWQASGKVRQEQLPVNQPQAVNPPANDPTVNNPPANNPPAVNPAANDRRALWSYDITGRAQALDLSVAQVIALTGADPQLPVPLEILQVTGDVEFRGNTIDGVQEILFDFSNLTTLQQNRQAWAVGSLKGHTTAEWIEIERGAFKIGPGSVDFAMRWNRVPGANRFDRLKLNLNSFALETLRDWGQTRPAPAVLAKDDQSLEPPARESRPFESRPLETDLASSPANRSRRTLAALGDVSGILNAHIDVQRMSTTDSFVVGWTGTLAASLDDVVVRGEAIGSLAARGELSERQWQGSIDGELLAAPISGTINVALVREPEWSMERVTGELNWTGAEARRLLALWQRRDQAAQWNGVTNVRAQVDWQPDGQTSGFVNLEVPRLAYRSRTIVRDMIVSGSFEDNFFRISRFAGSIAGGRADVSGAIDLGTRRPVGLNVNLQRISLGEAMQLFDPDMSSAIEGRADLRVRVAMNSQIDLHGTLRVRDVLWAGLPISEAHSDFELLTSPDWSLTRIHAANIRGRAFGGQLDGDLRSRLSTRSSIDLRATIRRGEVEQLSEWSGTASVVGRGKFDADLTLNTPNYQTTRDLQGRLDLSFEDTDARTLPIADQLARFVPLFGLPSTEFERGEMTAFINRGDLRIRSLAMWGRQLSVIGSGNVGMVSSRLDMQLVVRVGGGLSQQIAANYLTQLAATSVPPVELVLQINRLVSNRALFLRVGGTTAQPVIQPQAAQIVQQALLRSLLEQAAPGLSSVVGGSLIQSSSR